MKKRIIIYGFPLLIFIAGCHTGQPKAKQSAVQSEDIYTCSMHPQVLEQHAGNCPICGMVLIKKNTMAVATNNINLETLLKPTNEAVVSSIGMVSPERGKRETPVTAYGTVEYDTRTAGTISARIAGRIEKMYIRYRYQEVKKGQKIMDIYSPEMLTAQQNLIFLLQNDAANTSFIQAAKERLLLLGMAESQLEQVIRNRKPLYAVSVYSNYSGHVHDAGMMQQNPAIAGDLPGAGLVTQELSLKEGMYVQKGQTMLMIMDHHRVWAALQIFSSDQSLVKVGNAVRISPETDTSAVIKARIDFIEPFFRSNINTLTARVYFHNENMLPIGSHLKASIYVSMGNKLWLPQASVLSLGLNKVVFVKTDGGFSAHRITTGLRSGEAVEVITGLNEKDSVAGNAQYFTDSESFIKSQN